jgi:hypothetical protein
MIHCATSTPTQPHTDVLIATRRLKDNPREPSKGPGVPVENDATDLVID